MSKSKTLLGPAGTAVTVLLDLRSADELLQRHPHGAALDALACLVVDTAGEADRLHADLVRLSGEAAKRLQDAARDPYPGSSRLGVLQSTGVDIELVGAQRSVLHAQLDRLISMYRRALAHESGSRAAARSAVSAVRSSEIRPQHAKGPSPVAATAEAAPQSPASRAPGR